MSDHPRIYLQPECCADEEMGRVWCDHDAPDNCENGVKWTEYVRVDIAHVQGDSRHHCDSEQQQRTSETYYGKLFDFLESEFGITPIITEMNDLIEVVRSLPRYEADIKLPGHDEVMSALDKITIQGERNE